MSPEQFTYWLQGYMEIHEPVNLNDRETQIIKDHLALVFAKETPDRQRPPTRYCSTTLVPNSDKSSLVEVGVGDLSFDSNDPRTC